jgi:hypothetical protein
MRERDLREEDKEDGRGLGEGSWFFFVWRINWEKEKEKEKEEEILKGGGYWGIDWFLGTLIGTLLLLGILGSRARKPQRFLELWSQRGCS